MKSTWNPLNFTWNLPDFKIMSFWVITKYRSFFRKTKKYQSIWEWMNAQWFLLCHTVFFPADYSQLSHILCLIYTQHRTEICYSYKIYLLFIPKSPSEGTTCWNVHSYGMDFILAYFICFWWQNDPFSNNLQTKPQINIIIIVPVLFKEPKLTKYIVDSEYK